MDDEKQAYVAYCNECGGLVGAVSVRHAADPESMEMIREWVNDRLKIQTAGASEVRQASWCECELQPAGAD